MFLDRDGTLLRERGYLGSPQKLKLYPFAFKALALLKKAGYKLILVSNQSGVGRGLFTVDTVRRIHASLQKELGRKKVRLDGIYFCPHLPAAGCSCRKPKPGMARQAARKFGLDLKKSYVVGDQKRDMDLARNIGARGILVLTGGGQLEKGKVKSVIVKRNVLTAAQWILKSEYER